jgi:hypothetical protein
MNYELHHTLASCIYFRDALGHPQRNNSKRVPARFLSLHFQDNPQNGENACEGNRKLSPQPNMQPFRRSLASSLKSTATTLLPLSTRRPQVSHRHEDENGPIIVQCPKNWDNPSFVIG